MWGGTDEQQEAVLQEWANELQHTKGADVKAAIERMKEECLDYPPTLPRFLGFCRDAKRLREAAIPKLDGPKQEIPDAAKRMLNEFLRKVKNETR